MPSDSDVRDWIREIENDVKIAHGEATNNTNIEIILLSSVVKVLVFTNKKPKKIIMNNCSICCISNKLKSTAIFPSYLYFLRNFIT